MYYGSGTVDRIASGQLADDAATGSLHSPDGSTFLREMTHGCHLESVASNGNPTCQSLSIYT